MKIFKDLSRERFKERFPDRDSCLQYLAELKWAGNGYKCKKCQSTSYSKGKQPYSRRCTKCQYDESATSGTLFHKIKFSIAVAFEILYEIATSKKGANSIWLAERFGLQQKTTWFFRQKVQQAMKSSLEYPLTDEVHVDEFEIGTPQKGQQGRSASEEKVRVVIAIEHRNGKPGRGYAQVIKNYSCESLTSIFEQHISQDAKVETDGWSAYKPLKKDYPNLK
ncbi:IS1595 family transposase [Cytophagaceae bacterium ABcell3]|nr:IS1595 family transposase [Cytophagaceae bacterium ABcell3]